MNTLEEKMDVLQKDVGYIKAMMEDLTMNLSTNKKKQEAVNAQMNIVKNMFSNLPGLNPELKQDLKKIFEQVGGV